MLVVHAFWSPGRGAVLWAEDGQRPATTARRSLRSARPHPFAAPASQLAGIHPGKQTSVNLLLPSRSGGPVDSPELVRAKPSGRRSAELTLMPWSVPGVVVDPAELDDPAEDVRYGRSVAHLRALREFADDLVTRGRVLPTLRPGPEARWRPVVQGLDAVARRSLVEALPPVGRAEQRRAGDVAGHAPDLLVDDALAVFVDAAVRERLGRASEIVSLVPPRTGRAPKSMPATEAWLAALGAADSRFEAPERELATLAAALEPWDAVTTEETGPARATFRLAEIDTLHDPADPGDDPLDQTGDGTRWVLEFQLQSTEDPSLIVPAEDVWAGRADPLITSAQELLLAELGRAALVFPGLTPALRSARPEELDLDIEETHRFLTEDAARLLAAGFGVQLPAGWNGRKPLGLKLSVSSPGAPGVVTRGGLGREELARFRWTMAAGDEELDEEEIAALVAAKAKLVRIRGQWVSVDQQALARGLEFLRTQSTRRAHTVAETLGIAQGRLDTPLPVTAVTAEGWVGDLLRGTADRTLEPLDPPASFRATLRPYQKRGLSWLSFLASLGLGACLADDMGLGKTIQLLALEARERAGERRGPTLILCPMSLVGTWQREAARFAPDLRVHAHHGAGRAKGERLAEVLADTDIVVTTYGTAARDVEDLESHAWHRLVLDEAQAIKNAHAAPSKAARRIVAGHRIALTGTPMENRLAELWSVMDFLNPGMLGTPEAFRRRFAVPIERHGSPEAAETLRAMTRPYLLRRLKTDPTVIDDLPEKIEIRQEYRLTREQASLYRTIVDDMMEKIEDSQGIQRRGNVLAAMTKLKQVCNHPAHLLHDGSPLGRRSGKVARLEELLGEILAEGDKVLLFSQFTEFAAMLVPHLSARFDQEILHMHGGTPKKQRDAMVERFQSADGPSVFLLSLKAGGTGLTLTAANHVIHVDRWWNPAVEDQATDRAFRIGQQRNVQVRKFVCPGTVEERVDALIESKKALSDMVISDGEGWLTELSTSELRTVFALGAEAVGDE
ncbi:DEAD/DEAH box helicase [Pseudonocardia oroxyli]|uniref:Superfamily II DNA or RNA helicase, SNF2 family n=1 Tax=Pseudonocardia oroxyli TaxID=366584 RepID=A0A1G7ILV1_PSEOR|nr:DEAD/DEAH box helicase [Pseudonocardia oroxyli]SDF13707.1 Superfamily II DNA or RNA helicase, SNF2 family [Pseudonocardia oroxyli]